MLNQADTAQTASGDAKSPDTRKRVTILLTSAGRRVGLLQAFRRGASALDVDLELLACDLDPMLSAACHVADEAFAVPPVMDRGYADAILEICRTRTIDLIVPTIDPELLPLANAQAEFLALGAHVATSAPAVIQIARDKLTTAAFLAANGLATPPTAPLAAVRANPAGWTWPAIVKPRHGSAGRLVSTVKGPADLPVEENEPMIVQELLSGDEWTVNIYVDDAGRLRAV